MPHTSVNVVIYFLERRAYRLYFCIKLDTVMAKHSCVTAKVYINYQLDALIIIYS